VTTTGWEHFAHGADIGIRGHGQTCAEAFEQAALAMTAAVSDPNEIEPAELVEVTRSAPDDELLLVEWLNAIVYEMATRRMLFSRFEVRIDAGSLRGRAWGEKMNAEKHDPIVEIKGATYTCLHVGRSVDDGWVAQCEVDV
jgi:tRNA nucleotidyltransferase (CCA-adding enzyme)